MGVATHSIYVEKALLASIVRKVLARTLHAPAHLEPPLQRMRVRRQLDEFGFTREERAEVERIIGW